MPRATQIILPFHSSDAPRMVLLELLDCSSPKCFLLWIHGGRSSSLIDQTHVGSSRLRSTNHRSSYVSKHTDSFSKEQNTCGLYTQFFNQICELFWLSFYKCTTKQRQWPVSSCDICIDIPPVESVGRICCWDLSKLSWRPRRWRSCSLHCPLLTPWSCPPAPQWCSWICTAGCCSAEVQQYHLKKQRKCS